MAIDKSKVVEVVESPAVVETVVEEVAEVTEQEVTETEVAAVAETEVAEVPVPADFKGKELLVDAFAGEVAVLSGYVGGMETALQMVIAKNAGNCLLVSQSKEGVKERILLVPQNLLFIQAALASRPSLRPMFKSTVIGLIEAGRATEEYQKGLADLRKIEEDRNNVMDALRIMTQEFAEPFEAELFIALWSLDRIVEATPAAASATGKGRANRSSSKHDWSAASYPMTYKGEEFTLDQGAFEHADENGISRSWPWAIANSYGQIVAVGTSAADADKNWLASMGMSTSVNSAKRWNAAAVEAALKA